MRKLGQSAPIILLLKNRRPCHLPRLAPLAIGIASAADQSREPLARNDLVLRVILETDDEAISPRSAQRASASMMVFGPGDRLSCHRCNGPWSRLFAPLCQGLRESSADQDYRLSSGSRGDDRTLDAVALPRSR